LTEYLDVLQQVAQFFQDKEVISGERPEIRLLENAVA
jgi:hypothetical protein